MPSKTLADVAAAIAAAPDPRDAAAIVHGELAAAEKASGCVLLNFDSRRNALQNRALVAAAERDRLPVPNHASVAMDHLPAPVQFALLAGQRFADVGDQSDEYARLLGLEPSISDLRLLLKGIVIESALAAVVAVYDSRRRTAAKLSDRAAPLVTLFELAYARWYERDARFEAVAALHEVTSRLRAEHASVTAALDRELRRMKAAERAGTSEIVRGLRDAVAAAERRAEAAEQRLVAVEAQVVSAVERLEKAHTQLAEQDATIRAQLETIRTLERRLAALPTSGVGG